MFEARGDGYPVFLCIYIMLMRQGFANIVLRWRCRSAGLIAVFGSSAVIEFTTFAENSAQQNGGAVYNFLLYRTFSQGSISVSYSDLSAGSYSGCTGCIEFGPLMVDPDNGGFYLQPSSPCIDQVTYPVGQPELDKDGNPRPSCGPLYDFGAYEYQCP